jgi:hypothetical protein
MTNLSVEADATGQAATPSQSSARQTGSILSFAVIAMAAFSLYLISAVWLQARHATMHFGADSHLYAPLADGTAFERVVRFHPVTVVLASAWMTATKPLTIWFGAPVLLKAMFAAVGALGVWAALAALSALLPRRQALPWGLVYAASFGIWYFSGIEESKIVTATLCAAYIAVYLRLRERWSTAGCAFLTVILLVACLNEVVSGLLLVIPAVDTFVRRGWDLGALRWIAVHGLAGPVAFLILELAVNGWWVPRGSDAEGASHLGMLLFYVTRNDYSLATLYGFVLNWLLFNIAAPAPDARLWVAGMPYYGSYFEPALSQYVFAVVPAAVGAAFLTIVTASIVARERSEGQHADAGLLFALAAYSLLRGAFFLLFNPREVLLFTPAVTLAHVLLLALPFAQSRFPAKAAVATAAAALLLVNNGAFIIGR